LKRIDRSFIGRQILLAEEKRSCAGWNNRIMNVHEMLIASTKSDPQTQHWPSDAKDKHASAR
jgi:hypothetical protein